MFCKNCGQVLDDGAKFCTNCGATVTDDATQQNANNGGDNVFRANPVNGTMVPTRSIVTWVLLSILTCGICNLIWVVLLADDLNTASGDTNATSGAIVLLLSIVTCGIYLYFWFYKAGEQVNRAKAQRGVIVDQNTSLIYLLLSIFGLSIVSMALAQNELNNLAA